MKKIIAFIIVLGLYLAYDHYNSKEKIPDEGNTEKESTFSYLALGDSYTIGESVSIDNRYPNQLVNRLSKVGFITDSATIIAKTGWTTDELKAGIVERNIEGNTYDLVTLLIGVNNQYRGRNTENFRKEFIDLLKQAIAFAGGNPEKVIVISIPDWGVTPFAADRDAQQIAIEIDAYNAIKKEEAEALNVAFVDITPISRNAKNRPKLVAKDGLHPSDTMYKEWVNKVYPIALKILEK